jgi:hypothetical protein
MRPPRLAALLGCVFLSLCIAEAQVPQLINYQGRVLVGSTNFHGTGQFKFALVNGTGTTTYWSNDGTSTGGSQPTNSVALAVDKGLYSVLLGNALLQNMTAIPATVFNNPDVRLRIWFNDGTTGFQRLDPDQRIASVGYAMMATNVVDGAINSAKLAPGAVQPQNLAAGVGGTWQNITGTSLNAQANTSYAATSDSLTSIVLPTTVNVGDVVQVSGAGAGGWTIGGAAGHVISGLNVNLHSVWTPRASNRTWGGIASSADGSKLVAVVDGGQIFTSPNFGATWTARESTRFWQNVASSNDGTKLIAAAFNGQLYTSTDSGVTWTPRETARQWVDVASSADGTKLAAVVFGGQIYTSTDSGATWTPRQNARNWGNIVSSADGMKLVAHVDSGNIWTSIDGGVSWLPRELSRAWRGLASSADGTKLLATVNNGSLYTSTDSGATWTARESARTWQQAASSADGTRLVAVVANGQVYTSTDSGETWSPRDSPRNWFGAAASADGTRLAATVRGAQVYTSSPVLNGQQGEVASLQYVGNGEWRTLAHSQIAAGAITSAQIATGAVGAPQIANGAIGSMQLATGAVNTTHIANGAITAAQLAKPTQSGTITSATLTYAFGQPASSSVTFSPALTSTPAVTVSLEINSPDGTPPVPWVENKSLSGFTVRVPITPTKFVPDATGDVGKDGSLAVVSNRPAIAYYDATDHDVKFIRSNDSSGVFWGNPISLGGARGFSAISLQIVSANPAVAYFDGAGALRFVRATNTTGTAWSSSVPVDASAPGLDTSLAVISGNPAISYASQNSGGTSQSLKFVRATNATGTGWGTPVTLDASASITGERSSLAVVNGNPAISYYETTNARLRYVRATDATGTAWGTPVTVDDVATPGYSVGYGAKLLVLGGNPAIVYPAQDANGAYLKIIRANDANGATWGTPVVIDPAGGGWVSAAIVDGNPAVSYGKDEDVWYVRATNATGTTWGAPVRLDPGPAIVGHDTSLAVVNGYPAISYYDFTNRDLNFIRPDAPTVGPFTINWIALQP